MNTSSSSVESRWRTYVKAVAFLAPSVAVWALCCVFVFPKLKTLWRDADFMDSTMVGFMRTSDFFMEHGMLLSVSIIALMGLLEWRKGEWWMRYRRASVGTLVFVMNTAVLVLMLAMLVSAIVVAAGFAPRR